VRHKGKPARTNVLQFKRRGERKSSTSTSVVVWTAGRDAVPGETHRKGHDWETGICAVRGAGVEKEILKWNTPPRTSKTGRLPRDRGPLFVSKELKRKKGIRNGKGVRGICREG